MATIRPNNLPNEQSGATVRPTSNNTDTGANTQSTVRPGNPTSTVRPGQQQSTVRPSNPTSTVRPGQQQSTVRPKNQTVKPKTYSNPTSSTNDMADADSYQPRSSYIIGGVKYSVVEALSLTSGEAQVFLVEDPTHNKHVLKLYYKGATPNAAILNKVKSVNKACVFFNEESHGVFEDRYYELMKHYDGENLENTDVRKKEAAITEYIGKMAAAIDLCHHLGFIHRDIKPSNFIFESKDRKNILLGDFGIAVECDADGRCISDMARTKIYAAPEVYLNTGDGKAKFSTKSDFYSLGIVILFLWMGKDEFTHFEKENELQLATMKTYGNLPIPSNMSPRLYSLVKALIEPNPNDRAGFKEIEEWLKGGNPFGQTVNQASAAPAGNNFRIVFNGEKGLVATSAKELARIMMDNQTLAISYLYKGIVSRWLNDSGYPELAVEMDKIREDLFPRNTKAGLEAACYILNPSMPFTDICGNKCSTSAEIANSILENINGYMAQVSSDPDCRLLVYLQTHGLNQTVVDFRKEFARNKRLGILYLAYLLNPDQPWYMTDDEGATVALNSCPDILNWIAVNNASEQSLSDVVSNAFVLWVRNRNSIAAAAIKPLMKHEGDINYSFGVLYRLDPKVGLFFITDEKSPNYILSISQLGAYLNKCLMDVINNTDSDGTSRDILSLVDEIQNDEKNSIYHFLSSKGEGHSKYIEWIKYCLDVESTDNRKKAGPYYELIGLFRMIKGMGGEAFYTFKSGKTISNPSDLATVSKSDLEDAKHNKYRPLEAWLAVFFQEEPRLDKGTKYAYESKTSEYVNFLAAKGFESPEIQRYINSKQTVETRAAKLRETLSAIKKSKVLVALCSLLPLGVAALLLALFWHPEFAGLKFNDVIVPIGVILTVIICIADGFAGRIIGEAVWGFGLGAAVSVLIEFLSRYASTFTPYIAAALVVALGIYLYNKCIGTNLKEQENDDLLNPGFEHLELEPLHEAYHPTGNTFDSSIGDRTAAYQRELNTVKKTMWTKAIPIGIITIVGIVYFMFLGGNLSNAGGLDQSPDTTTTLDPTFYFSDGLYGKWVGDLEGQRISIQFEKSADPKKFSFSMKGLGDGSEKIIFSGDFDSLNKELKIKHLKVTKNASFGAGLKASGTLTLDKDMIFGDVDLMNPKDGDSFISIPINVQYEKE